MDVEVARPEASAPSPHAEAWLSLTREVVERREVTEEEWATEDAPHRKAGWARRRVAARSETRRWSLGGSALRKGTASAVAALLRRCAHLLARVVMDPFHEHVGAARGEPI